MKLARIKNDKARFVVKKIIQTFLVLLGTFIIAIANAFFLVPYNIVGGGISGLGIVLAEIGLLSVDVWQYILYWGVFLLGSLLLGFKFTINTLISTIFYPIFLTILVRTSIGIDFVNLLYGGDVAELKDGVLTVVGNWTFDSGRLLVIALFGGIVVGIGAGLTFIGGGSSGGADILAFIVNKYTNIPISASTFIVDGSIVVLGLIVDIVMPGSEEAYILFFAGLVGIFTAFGASYGVEKVYNTSIQSYMCDVISDKYEEIIVFVREDLNRTTTIFKVVGGYSQKEKVMLRIIFSKREYLKVKDGLAKIDPNAFVTYTQTHAVNGEGFIRNVSSKANSIDEVKDMIKWFKNRKNKDNTETKETKNKQNNGE